MTLSPELEAEFVGQQQRLINEITAQLQAKPEQKWETPAHREIDPFDAEYDVVMSVERGLIPHVKSALERGFHVFALAPKNKMPLPGSQGFKDSKNSSDSQVLDAWNLDPNRNIGIDLGASNLC